MGIEFTSLGEAGPATAAERQLAVDFYLDVQRLVATHAAEGLPLRLAMDILLNHLADLYLATTDPEGVARTALRHVPELLRQKRAFARRAEP